MSSLSDFLSQPLTIWTAFCARSGEVGRPILVDRKSPPLISLHYFGFVLHKCHLLRAHNSMHTLLLRCLVGIADRYESTISAFLVCGGVHRHLRRLHL